MIQNIKEKRGTYLNQLLFYSYILHKKYPHVNEYELRLIFLRDDKYSTLRNVERIEVENFGKVIADSVTKIRNKEFDEFTEGCKNMKYYYLDKYICYNLILSYFSMLFNNYLFE